MSKAAVPESLDKNWCQYDCHAGHFEDEGKYFSGRCEEVLVNNFDH